MTRPTRSRLEKAIARLEAGGVGDLDPTDLYMLVLQATDADSDVSDAQAELAWDEYQHRLEAVLDDDRDRGGESRDE